jgi:hypothetical protein
MIKLWAKLKRGRRKRQQKKEKTSWWAGWWKKIRTTKNRQIKRELRTTSIKKVSRTINYQAFLRSRLFNFLLVGVLLYMAFLTGREALVNFYQTKQLARIEDQNNTIREKNQEMVYLLEYYKTETYAELEARAQLNLKKPGEKVAIVPVDLNEDYNELTPSQQAEVNRTNYQKWWDFLFGDFSKIGDGS